VIAIDTNLLIYAHRVRAPEHRAAQRAIDLAAAAGPGWGISLPCIAEFWSIVTNPAAAGGPTPVADAARFLTSLVRDGEAQMWGTAAGFAERLWCRRIAVSAGHAFSIFRSL
jgi:predicted nucleic acid-binding protein